MALHDSSAHKTPHGILEGIITHKKKGLLEDTQTPERIRSMLNHTSSIRRTAEIIGYIVFPKRSEKTKDPIWSQSVLRGVLLGNRGKDEEFQKLKTKIQHADHLTEHTRLTLLNILDDIR